MCLQDVQERVFQALLAKQLLPLLSKLALLDAQIGGGCKSAQEPQALGTEKDSWGGTGCKTSAAGTGPPKAENLWRGGS